MIYYTPQFGLGNIIQTTPAVRYLQTLDQVAIIATPKTAPFIHAVYGKENVYQNAVLQRGDQHFQSCNPSQFRQLGGISEVELNLQMVGCNPLDADRVGSCHSDESEERFDIVIANGYNKSRNLTDWAVKLYPHFEQVIKAFPELKIASVGLPEEYIPGTINRTGIGLGKTFGLLKNARLVVANDTGLYHAAAALGARTLALFTMTDTHKNYDAVFHKTASIISTKLECQPCQLTSHKAWIKNKHSCHWECQHISWGRVVARINEELPKGLYVKG